MYLFHSFGEQLHGIPNLWLNTLAWIRDSGSWYSSLISRPSNVEKNWSSVLYSLSSKHSTVLLYGNKLFRVSFLASHPQSIPVASLNFSTTALIPVAVVIFSTVSPSPLDLVFLLRVVFVVFFALVFDFFPDIFQCVKYCIGAYLTLIT